MYERVHVYAFEETIFALCSCSATSIMPTGTDCPADYARHSRNACPFHHRLCHRHLCHRHLCHRHLCLLPCQTYHLTDLKAKSRITLLVQAQRGACDQLSLFHATQPAHAQNKSRVFFSATRHGEPRGAANAPASGGADSVRAARRSALLLRHGQAKDWQ